MSNKSEVRVIVQGAKTIYISHPEASYGIFCYNSMGDLFLNSDYGMYGYAWRSFGDDFEKFLSDIDSSYLIGKFETNQYTTTNKRKIPTYSKEKIMILLGEFKRVLNEIRSIAPIPSGGGL